MTYRNIYEETAARMIREHGFVEAKRIAAKDRDQNSPGTTSFAFHQAVCKAFNTMASVGKA